MQMQADALEIPVLRPAILDTTAIGSALVSEFDHVSLECLLKIKFTLQRTKAHD